MRATTARATTSTVLERAWCSPTHLAAKTETCQTFAVGQPYGRTREAARHACRSGRRIHKYRSWKAHLALMKTQCPVNLPTWCPGARRQSAGFAGAKPCHGCRLCLLDGSGPGRLPFAPNPSSDVMLAGASDRTMDPATFAKILCYRGAFTDALLSV